jgi:hypothetical protein
VLWARQAGVDKQLDRTARHVLWALALHANRKGEAWPSEEVLAEECGLNRVAVIKAFGRIAKAKVVGVRKRPGFTIVWTFPKLSTARGSPALPVALTTSVVARSYNGGSAELPEASKEATKKQPTGRNAFFLPGSGWIR